MNTVFTLLSLCAGAVIVPQASCQYRQVLFVPTGEDGSSQQKAPPVTYPEYTAEEMALSKRQYQAAFAAMASKMAAQHGLLSTPQQNTISYRPPLKGLYHRKLVTQVSVEPQPMVLQSVVTKRRQVTPLPPQTPPVHLYQPPTLQKVYNYEAEAPRARPVQLLPRPTFAQVQNVYKRVQESPRPVQVYQRPLLQRVQYTYGNENPEQELAPQQPNQVLVVLPNGFLADTQEVQAAKEAHFAEVARSREAAARAVALEQQRAQSRPAPVEYTTPAVQYSSDEEGRQYYTVHQPNVRYVKYIATQ